MSRAVDRRFTPTAGDAQLVGIHDFGTFFAKLMSTERKPMAVTSLYPESRRPGFSMSHLMKELGDAGDLLSQTPSLRTEYLDCQGQPSREPGSAI